MRAIIVAAGLGKRLRPLTDSLPKCMLKIGEKSIIQHQVDILTSLGIEEIGPILGSFIFSATSTGEANINFIQDEINLYNSNGNILGIDVFMVGTSVTIE